MWGLGNEEQYQELIEGGGFCPFLFVARCHTCNLVKIEHQRPNDCYSTYSTSFVTLRLNKEAATATNGYNEGGCYCY